MTSPYAAIFDSSQELTDQEKHRLGLVTAALVFRWQQWIHRRVELVSIVDKNVIRRRNSIDFTFPRWALEWLGVKGSDAAPIAVPLAFFRKGTLVHFNLDDESQAAVPLLSRFQNATLAEAALLAMAEIALPGEQVPCSVACDIRRVACDRSRPAAEARDRLFSQDEPDPEARDKLHRHRWFNHLATALAEQHIAAVFMPISADARRVIHFAYDEVEYDVGQISTWRRIGSMLRGRRSIRYLVFVPNAGDPASYHFEVEAPEGLQISSREVFRGNPNIISEERVESYQRAHIHFPKVSRGTRVAVLLRLRPRSSTIVRSAALMSLLITAAVLYVFLRLVLGSAALQNSTATAAAVLLVVPALLSAYLVRINEHLVTTHLLWPLRITASMPGVFSFMAAGVLATGGGGGLWGQIALGVLTGMLAVCTSILCQTWWIVHDRDTRYETPSQADGRSERSVR